MSTLAPDHHPGHRRALLWLFCLGMALRVIWALMVPVEPVSDSRVYENLARNLVEHGVFGFLPKEPDAPAVVEPSAYWAVGTSAIIAATYLVFGESHAGVVLTNLVAGGAIILLTHALASRFFGAAAALWATAIVAFWPNLIFFTTILSSELYFMVLCLGGLWFWKRPDGPALANLLLCGVIWGLACYVRPVVLLVPVALLLAELPQGVAALARTAARAAVTLALIVAVVAPWTWRNHQVMGEAVLVSTNFGPNLWMGNNPDSTGGYMRLPPEVMGMSEVGRADYLGDLAKAYMLENPLGTLQRTLVKALQLHNRETIGVVWNRLAVTRLYGEGGMQVLKLVATGYWYAILLAALAGLVLRLRSAGFFGAVFHPVVALWAYFTALHAVIVVEDRYHMPSSPYIAMLAALALAALWQKRGARPQGAQG